MMTVAVRCEARINPRWGVRCRNDVTAYRHVNGQSYGLCTAHRRLPLPLLHLEAPQDFEGLQRAYREAHPRARRDGA